MEIFLLLALIYFSVLVFGFILEKFRIPWIFGALLLGVLFSSKTLVLNETEQTTLEILGNLGMLFLLYIIGFEMKLSEYKKHGKYIIKATAFVILFEALLGGLTLHYIFHYGMKVAFLVALSLATIGEAVLIPILDEFNLSNTKIGQMIIGIGTLDDIFEIISIFLVSLIIGSTISAEISVEKSILTLFVLVVLSSMAIKSKKIIRKEFVHRKIKYFLLILFMGDESYGL